MKLLHTGDLHIGKYVHEFSMLEDQRHILSQIAGVAVRESVDALLITGDVYDRAVPTAEAVTILDEFLTGLLKQGILIFAISGNHDSPERVGFASRILEKQGLYITGMYEDGGKKVTLNDAFGKVSFFSLPYCKPGVQGCADCQEMLERMVKTMQVDTAERNVLLTHYFVTDGGRTPLLSDSETAVHVGGLDNVDADLFAAFDYTALGHIHRPQRIGEGAVYYAGSPLKYSFSEAGCDKSVNIITLEEKGKVSVRQEMLSPLRGMRCIRGRLDDILQAAAGKRSEDYVQVTLTDEDEPYDPIGTLRGVYPNLMQLLLSKNEPEQTAALEWEYAAENRSPLLLYEDFYREVRGMEMDEARRRVIEEAMKEAEGE